LCFALKTPKNHQSGDFYPATSVGPKVRSTPGNRDFRVTVDAKIHKRNKLPGGKNVANAVRKILEADRQWLNAANSLNLPFCPSVGKR
jgi:hypothetical protein